MDFTNIEYKTEEMNYQILIKQKSHPPAIHRRRLTDRIGQTNKYECILQIRN